MLCRDLGCVFVHIPKTGGTSIGNALGGYQGTFWEMQDHRTAHEIVHGDDEGDPPELSRAEFDRLFSFAFVRNPWDRVFSWYRNVMSDPRQRDSVKVDQGCSLRRFLEDHAGQWALRPQWDYICDRSTGRPMVNFVGRFERLEKDFRLLAQVLGLEDLALPHYLASAPADYREAYDRESIDLIRGRYREEIEIFGYRF